MKKILFNSLPKDKKIFLTKKKFSQKSYFQKKISNGKSYKKINISSYSQILRNEILRLLKKKKIINKKFELEQIHKQLDKSMKNYNLNNGVNKISQMFYENDDEFKSVYFSFIKFLSKNIFKFKFYFQTIPTIRFQCPGGKNRTHYPRYHNDIAYGHPFEEINLWIPLTFMNKQEKHGFRMMSLYNSKKILKKYGYSLDNFVNDCIKKRNLNFRYNPLSPKVKAQFGEMLAFDSRCFHTGESMNYQTRVSIDIRIIGIKDYNNSKYKYQGLGKRKILFEPGKCYFKSNLN